MLYVMYVCVHVCSTIRISRGDAYTHTYRHICIHTYIHICIPYHYMTYVYMHVCVYVGGPEVMKIETGVDVPVPKDDQLLVVVIRGLTGLSGGWVYH